jgi:hypothetical protein
MGKYRFLTIKIVSTLGPILWCTVAFAQGEDASGDSAPVRVPIGSSETTVVVNPPSTTSTTQTSVSPWGVPSGPPDPGEGGTYGFDLSGAGRSETVRGGSEGSYVLSSRPSGVPDHHTVRRGDTLWDLCGHYYDNPYSWPRVWSYNPQIENPHWIYPGDRIRMKAAQGQGMASRPQHDGGFVRQQGMMPPGSIFLRDYGFVGDESKDVWGALVGSPDDQMLLSDGDEAYVQIDKDDKDRERDVRIGQEFSLFRRLRKPEAGKSKGNVVAIKGTVRVNQWNPKTRIARVSIIESLDVIERGDKVGPIGRRFDVVPPVANEREVWAQITGAIQPRELLGQHHVVFIDKGSKHGLRPGNRLFVVVRGDRWDRSVQVGRRMAASRIEYRLHSAEVQRAPDTVRGKKFPTEVVGEVRVLRTREETSICVVTHTEYELEPGQPLLARRGY